MPPGKGEDALQVLGTDGEDSSLERGRNSIQATQAKYKISQRAN